MIKLLIFDLWGTIIANGVYSPTRQVRRILNLNIPFRDYIVRFEKTLMLKEYSDLYEAFKAVCNEFNVKEEAHLLNRLVGLWNKNWLLAKPFDGALDILNELKKNYKMALVSNTDNSAERIVEKYNLNNYFDKIYFSFKTGYLKINPELFEKIMKDFRVKPEEVVMIGDSIESDMKTPSSLGIKTILVDLKQRRVYPVKIKNIRELPEIIKSIQK